MDSARISKTRCGMGMCELAHTQIGFLWNAGGRHPVRHSPDSRPFRGQDRVSDRLGQRQIAVATSKGPSKLVVDGGPTLKRAALLLPRHTSPLIARCTWLALVMPAQAVPAAERSAPAHGAGGGRRWRRRSGMTAASI